MSTQLKNKLIRIAVFLFMVVIPWFLVIYYTLNYAHPRYVSTSEVVVKQIGDNSIGNAGGIVSLLAGASTSVEDANYLTNYILSQDMLKQLDPKFQFAKNYHLDGQDPIYELKTNPTQEELLEYFRKRVSVSLDQTTHILSVSTQGFTPEYALALNEAILKQSEKFVNEISQQTAKDQLTFAEKQLADATERLNEAKSQLLSYQNKNEILDPSATAKAINSLVAGLEVNLSTLRTEERQLLSYLNPDAPQVVSLRSQIQALEEQIVLERAKLTSPSNNKLNTKALEFEEIKAKVTFAEDLYKLSLTSLEKSRLEAFRKMKNLIVISAPYKAEEAKYPRVGYVISTSLVMLLIFYGFVQLIMAIIRDHRD